MDRTVKLRRQTSLQFASYSSVTSVRIGPLNAGLGYGILHHKCTLGSRRPLRNPDVSWRKVASAY